MAGISPAKCIQLYCAKSSCSSATSGRPGSTHAAVLRQGCANCRRGLAGAHRASRSSQSSRSSSSAFWLVLAASVSARPAPRSGPAAGARSKAMRASRRRRRRSRPIRPGTFTVPQTGTGPMQRRERAARRARPAAATPGGPPAPVMAGAHRAARALGAQSEGRRRARAAGRHGTSTRSTSTKRSATSGARSRSTRRTPTCGPTTRSRCMKRARSRRARTARPRAQASARNSGRAVRSRRDPAGDRAPRRCAADFRRYLRVVGVNDPPRAAEARKRAAGAVGNSDDAAYAPIVADTKVIRGAFSDVAARTLVPGAQTRGYRLVRRGRRSGRRRAKSSSACCRSRTRSPDPVPRNYELLWEHPSLRIRGETTLAIELCLIGVAGARRERRPRDSLASGRARTGAPLRRRARLGARDGDGHGGCGARHRRARRSAGRRDRAGAGGRDLRRHDPAPRRCRTKPRTTLASSRSQLGDGDQSGDRACVGIAVADRPGSLRDALSAFADRAIDLRFLIARPDRRVPFRYRFFVELANVDDARLRRRARRDRRRAAHPRPLLRPRC
jgi:hypothetical protein